MQKKTTAKVARSARSGEFTIRKAGAPNVSVVSSGKKTPKTVSVSIAKTGTRSSGLQIGKRHYQVKIGDVLEAHEQSLEAFGGLPGISNLDSVLGAIGRPYHGYHRRIHAKAAALLHGIATSHGFNDANKRTSWLTTEILIANSGFQLDLLDEDRLDDVVVDVVTGDMTQDELAEWFKARISKL